MTTRQRTDDSISRIVSEFTEEMANFDRLLARAQELTRPLPAEKRKKASRIDWPMFFFCLALATLAAFSI